MKINPELYSAKHLKYLDNFLNTYKNKVALIEFRNNILRKQRSRNIQNESDRVNSYLSNSMLSQSTPNYKRLKERADELSKLGAKAFNRSIAD
jgi:hypothetical protein